MSKIKQKIGNQSIQSYAEEATMIYGTEVLENRAVPDYRDGLKPVQRAILWSMYNLKLHYNGPYKKAARTVGDCFVAGTLVETTDGLVPIQDITTDHVVCTRFGDYGVEEIYWMPKQPVFKITLVDGKSVTVTRGQKFFVLRDGVESWIECANIVSGDKVLVSNKMTFDFVKIANIEQLHDEITYDIQVKNVHEFIANSIVSHNCIGMYHPRGDSPTYEAMTKLVNTPIPIIDGFGNWGSHVENAAAMRYCFVAGTKIMTEYGLINIEKIPYYYNATQECPKSLTTVDTNYCVSSTQDGSVATKWLNSGLQETVIVTTKNGYKVQCTPNQPFLVLDENLDYVWKPIEELYAGDSICVSGGYIDYNIQSKLSAEDAFIIGVLTKTVLNGNNILYSDIKTKRYGNVLNILTSYFGRNASESTKNDKNYCSIDIDRKLINLTLYDWNEYTSFVPSAIFECDEKSVASFCRAIVIMYGKIVDYSLHLNCRSENLLGDVKQLLLNYFGVITTAIRPENNGYYAMQMFSNDASDEFRIIPDGMLKNIRRIEYINKIPHVRNWLNSKIIDAYTDDNYSDDDINRLRLLSDYSEILYRQIVIEETKKECEIVIKLRSVVDNGYIYDTISSVVDGDKHYTFDLTVDKTHAFFANGFIAHNTEARLSEFTDKYLLDPEYMSVVPMQKNYSEDRLLPVVLPAKVPNMLLVGNTSIAVGVSASSPPFALRGVLALTIMTLNKKPITPKLCEKYLRFNYKYGGNCISTHNEIYAVISSGKGTLSFEPSYVEDYKLREFIITSTCPGLNSENSLSTLFKKIELIPGVKLIHDAEDSTGIKYTIQFGKIGEEKVASGFEAIKKLIVRKESYDFGVVERGLDNTHFFRTNVVNIIERWCEWRIEIELLVIKQRIAQCKAVIAKIKLFVLAVNNIDTIAAALKKDDSEKYLVSKLKCSPEDAKFIMNMRLNQVKKMNSAKLTAEIGAENAKLKSHLNDFKVPVVGIIKELERLIHVNVKN